MFKQGCHYKFRSEQAQDNMYWEEGSYNAVICDIIGDDSFRVMNLDHEGNVLEFYVGPTLYIAGVTPGLKDYVFLIDHLEYGYFEEVKTEEEDMGEYVGKAEPQWHVVIVGSECINVCSSFEKASEAATKAKKDYPSKTVEIYARVAVANATITIDKE